MLRGGITRVLLQHTCGSMTRRAAMMMTGINNYERSGSGQTDDDDNVLRSLLLVCRWFVRST